MPKLSPEKRAELEALLAADDQADDEYEIEIRDGDKAVRMPAGKGTPWLKKHFPDLYEELLGEGADDEGEGDGKPAGQAKQPPAKDNTVRFGRRVS